LVDVVNRCSGRNNTTTTMSPNNVFTGDFAARFAMALMEKDRAMAAPQPGACGIA
jgi:3-hydroxyisobutyrate dehydrogenase-like beta-hydroxyacid dehydrogenase